MMTIKALNHVALHVAHVEISVQFYHNVLRLPLLPRPAFDFPGAWFRLGGNQELHLLGNRKETVFSDSRGTHFALEVTNLDEWATHLATIKAEYRPPKARPDGARQIFVIDPDGHWIELVEFGKV
ncbi:MAG: glyoxalase [Runella slithyformis]|nr:MAG: glyoxalase [Runella slithyformis]TAG23049.1 MAG: glyoxalase [Cytophagales bacterium]TAG42832.1 MAG: glyoxalase [Cytophagia bacterium]TAF02108.1 MAG: glyoxalase [Runella slithyformis]TAF25039.1 MAG: glyoxalase [Runella slithyformis]